MDTTTQEREEGRVESLTDKIAVSVAPSEKLKVQFVAGAAGTTVSELLREILMPEIESRHRRISERLVGAV